MSRLVVEGWLLGLSTGPYCFGACAPLLVPYLFAAGRRSWRGTARLVGEFLLGRLVAYVIFGALVGWVGALARPHVTHRLTALAVALASVLMLAYALRESLPRWPACTRWVPGVRRLRMPLALGLLVGFNVCPPFVAAVARLLQVGHVGSGALFFLGFFVGTSLFVLPLVGVSPFTRVERLQRIGRLSALLVGGWLLCTAIASW